MKKIYTLEGIEDEYYYNMSLFDYRGPKGETFGSAISVSFVDYIPNDLEDSKIVDYTDLSDTEMGTPEGSIIAWVEDSGQKGDYDNTLYNAYIGSESKIYAKDLSYLFSTTRVEIVDFSNLNTSETTNMSHMFDGYNGTTLDLSAFDTSKVTDMSCMFLSCSNLITLDLSGFTFDNITGNGEYGDGNSGTFGDVPSECVVKIKSSQREIFEDKFSLNGNSERTFTPSYVD